MKKINITKKSLALLLIFIILLSIIQPVALAISSTGTEKWVAGQWDSGVFTTDNKTSVGMLLRRLVNYTTGERITVFCRRTLYCISYSVQLRQLPILFHKMLQPREHVKLPILVGITNMEIM